MDDSMLQNLADKDLKDVLNAAFHHLWNRQKEIYAAVRLGLTYK